MRRLVSSTLLDDKSPEALTLLRRMYSGSIRRICAQHSAILYSEETYAVLLKQFPLVLYEPFVIINQHKHTSAFVVFPLILYTKERPLSRKILLPHKTIYISLANRYNESSGQIAKNRKNRGN